MLAGIPIRKLEASNQVKLSFRQVTNGRSGESGERCFAVVNDAFAHEFPELLPPDPRADERAEVLLDGRVHGFVCIPVIGEDYIPSGVPRRVEGREFAVFDGRSKHRYHEQATVGPGRHSLCHRLGRR